MTCSRFCNTTNKESNPPSSIRRQRLNLVRGLWLAVILFALVSSSVADDRQKAMALIERAAAASRLSNLKGAYTLKVSFRVPGERGTEGTYQYWSVEPFRWRMEIKARGYHETDVGEPDKRWVAADLPYTPDPIQTLIQLVASGTTVSWPVGNHEVRIRHEADGQCFVMKQGKKNDLHVCFDPASSLLHTVVNSAGNRFEFLDYQSIDGRQVPRKLMAYDRGYLVVDAKLDSLATVPPPDPALLTPPPNAEAWDWCENMEPPKLLRAVQPKMPRGSWAGENRFWVVVGTDGHVEEGGLMESAGPALDRAAADAMKQWLFRPAVCNGLPIRVKTTASFAFER